jgi:hypothetical protein
MAAILNEQYDVALYLLDKGAKLKKVEKLDYNSVLKLVCSSGEVRPENPINQAQLQVIKALLRHGLYLNHEAHIKLSYGIDLTALRQEILDASPWFKLHDKQLLKMTAPEAASALIDTVSVFLKANGPVGFYEMASIVSGFNIDEKTLSILIQQLEKKATPMAYLVCGLLLEGYIENTVAVDRYPGGEKSEAYQAYMEKRSHDAITFYAKASSDSALKKVTDIL